MRGISRLAEELLASLLHGVSRPISEITAIKSMLRCGYRLFKACHSDNKIKHNLESRTARHSNAMARSSFRAESMFCY